MYTLGGGIDPERGWGHRDETWHAKEELAAYGVQPDWFGLGDRDLATHLVRSQMLRAGYPLSQVTTALCDRWSPGATLLPASDDRCETHVVVTEPDSGDRKAGQVDSVTDVRPRRHRRDGACRSGSRRGTAVSEHGAAARIEILPVTGLPEFRAGDDLGAAIASAAPWLEDGDIVVVTSKVVSKCEGRTVPAPADPEQRDTLRRNLIDREAVRVLARRGRTLITENKQGLIQAAAGVDGSNVDPTELVLLPLDPDASAAGLRAALAERCGVTVAVLITDT
ncbi:MAG: hypothetical protein EBU54_09345, partial [Mycobacteriaceae bacterium]|nr:hypothetical protein [Mycobacteriaceae bacterium]